MDFSLRRVRAERGLQGENSVQKNDPRKLYPLSKMADEEGRVTMSAAQVKSLVSEQYLDGWSYDDEDEAGSPASRPSSCENQTNKQVTVSGSPGKRRHSSMDSGVGSEEPAEKKKFSMSISGKGGRAESGQAESNSNPSADSRSSLTSGMSAKIGISIGPSSTKLNKPVPIKMNLSSQLKPKAKEAPVTSSLKKTSAMARAFGDDSDESEEEMPAEARMRMRNIGRETPTAAGPNSFGKGNLGFCNRQKIIERELQKTSGDSE